VVNRGQFNTVSDVLCARNRTDGLDNQRRNLSDAMSIDLLWLFHFAELAFQSDRFVHVPVADGRTRRNVHIPSVPDDHFPRTLLLFRLFAGNQRSKFGGHRTIVRRQKFKRIYDHLVKTDRASLVPVKGGARQCTRGQVQIRRQSIRLKSLTDKNRLHTFDEHLLVDRFVCFYLFQIRF
jgi:hypothetical protein